MTKNLTNKNVTLAAGALFRFVTKRQLEERADHESVTHILTRNGALGSQVKGILRLFVKIRSVIRRFGKSVGGKQLKFFTHAFVKCECQSVISRARGIFQLIDPIESRIEPAWTKHRSTDLLRRWIQESERRSVARSKNRWRQQIDVSSA